MNFLSQVPPSMPAALSLAVGQWVCSFWSFLTLKDQMIVHHFMLVVFFFLQSVLILAGCWWLDCLKSGNNPRELFLPTVSFLLSCWTKRTEARSRCCSAAGCFSAWWVKKNILDTRKGMFVIKVVRKWQHVKMTIIFLLSVGLSPKFTMFWKFKGKQ